MHLKGNSSLPAPQEKKRARNATSGRFFAYESVLIFSSSKPAKALLGLILLGSLAQLIAATFLMSGGDVGRLLSEALGFTFVMYGLVFTMGIGGQFRGKSVSLTLTRYPDRMRLYARYMASGLLFSLIVALTQFLVLTVVAVVLVYLLPQLESDSNLALSILGALLKFLLGVVAITLLGLAGGFLFQSAAVLSYAILIFALPVVGMPLGIISSALSSFVVHIAPGTLLTLVSAPDMSLTVPLWLLIWVVVMAFLGYVRFERYTP